jgi:8-oxo-dGTP pyrophosphatase MutT (NUDIX family)
MDYREDASIRMNNLQARGFVINDDKILMMFRRKAGKEYYVFPGGHMQKGEAPEDTALREVEEETTVKCTIYKKAYEFINYQANEPEYEYYFVCQYISGEPTLSGEESRRANETNYYEPMWVKIVELASLNILPVTAKGWIIENISKLMQG